MTVAVLPPDLEIADADLGDDEDEPAEDLFLHYAPADLGGWVQALADTENES